MYQIGEANLRFQWKCPILSRGTEVDWMSHRSILGHSPIAGLPIA